MMNKTIKVFEDDCAYFPTKATEFLAFWQEKLMLIPVEYRDSAEIEIETYQSYESEYIQATVSYTRPENKEEKQERENREACNDKVRKHEKLRMYNQLKQELDL